MEWRSYLANKTIWIVINDLSSKLHGSMRSCCPLPSNPLFTLNVFLDIPIGEPTVKVG